MTLRIRSIKPEWLEDQRLMSASAEARVLSVALIVLADDYGNGRAGRIQLAGRVFPGSPVETLEKALEELSTWFITLYEADGQQYYSIRNWSKHQKVDKPGKPKVPGPLPTLENVRETLEKVPASCASRSTPDPDPDPIPDPDPAREPDGDPPPMLATRAKLWVQDPQSASLIAPAPWTWRETIEVTAHFDVTYGGTPVRMTRWGDPRLQAIVRWFADGKTPDDLRVVIDGSKLDDHYAKNPQFQTLTLILKDEAQLERFTRLARAAPKARVVIDRTLLDSVFSKGATG